MGADVGLQILDSILDLSFIGESYVNNIPKRPITGFMFGVGFSVYIFAYLRYEINATSKPKVV